MTLEFFHNSSRLFVGVADVNIEISSALKFKICLKVAACCTASGLVGAKKRTFELLNLCKRCAATITAIKVFPSPVGSTTIVFLFADVAIIAS